MHVVAMEQALLTCGKCLVTHTINVASTWLTMSMIQCGVIPLALQEASQPRPALLSLTASTEFAYTFHFTALAFSVFIMMYTMFDVPHV